MASSSYYGAAQKHRHKEVLAQAACLSRECPVDSVWVACPAVDGRFTFQRAAVREVSTSVIPRAFSRHFSSKAVLAWAMMMISLHNLVGEEEGAEAHELIERVMGTDDAESLLPSLQSWNVPSRLLWKNFTKVQERR